MTATNATRIFDILVLGAGPAGAVIARRLRALGYDVAMIARERSRGIREGLSERAFAGLLHAGCDTALRTVPPAVPRHARWGGDQTAVVNGERLLDRDRFDEGLRQDAVAAGVVLHAGRIDRLEDADGIWTAAVATDGGTEIIHAQYLVEARGRQAPRRRILARGPQTLATARPFRARDALTPATYVESLDNGWIWAAAPGDGTIYVQAVGDPPGAGITPSPEPLLARSRLVAPLIGEPIGPVIARDAGMVLHADLVTPRMLRVGDAAFAIDPLSGHGLYEAVAGALRGAAVVHTLIQHPERGGLARRFYENRARGAFLRHARTGRDFYRAQRRFADAPFWTARRDWPDEAPIHAAPDAAPPEIARRPVLVGQTIEEREVVVTADHPDGVYVIDGVPLVPLLRLAQEANATPALLAENLAAAPVQVEKALAWLRLRGLLPSLTSGAPAP